MLSKFLMRKQLTSALLGLFLLALLSAFVLSSCDAGKSASASLTPLPTAVATDTPEPPVLPQGKNMVLYLTNKSQATVATSGAFYVKKAYTIFALCTGSGKLQVKLTPGGTSTFLCSQYPQLQGANYGDRQHPPALGNVSVQVTAPGQVLWELSVLWQA